HVFRRNPRPSIKAPRVLAERPEIVQPAQLLFEAQREVIDETGVLVIGDRLGRKAIEPGGRREWPSPTWIAHQLVTLASELILALSACLALRFGLHSYGEHGCSVPEESIAHPLDDEPALSSPNLTDRRRELHGITREPLRGPGILDPQGGG